MSVSVALSWSLSRLSVSDGQSEDLWITETFEAFVPSLHRSFETVWNSSLHLDDTILWNNDADTSKQSCSWCQTVDDCDQHVSEPSPHFSQRLHLLTFMINEFLKQKLQRNDGCVYCNSHTGYSRFGLIALKLGVVRLVTHRRAKLGAALGFSFNIFKKIFYYFLNNRNSPSHHSSLPWFFRNARIKKKKKKFIGHENCWVTCNYWILFLQSKQILYGGEVCDVIWCSK